MFSLSFNIDATYSSYFFTFVAPTVFVYIQGHFHIYRRPFFTFSLVTFSTSSGVTNVHDMSLHGEDLEQLFRIICSGFSTSVGPT